MRSAGKWMMLIAFSVTLTAGLAFNVQAADMVGPEAMETDTGIQYMTGGVGIESRARMNMAADRYNLKVVVAAASGAYLADAMVTIKDAAGNIVFKAMTDGPWLMVKLPKGKYRVTAAIDNRKEGRSVSLSSYLKTITFHWKMN